MIMKIAKLVIPLALLAGCASQPALAPTVTVTRTVTATPAPVSVWQAPNPSPSGGSVPKPRNIQACFQAGDLLTQIQALKGQAWLEKDIFRKMGLDRQVQTLEQVRNRLQQDCS